MRLVCPNCDAKYEVSDDAIPEGGRDVQCANCGHAWYQMKLSAAADAPVEAELESGAIQPEAEVPATAAAYGVDDSVLAILREEADRESKARLVDAQQADAQQAGAGDAEADGAMTVAQKRAAMLRGEPAEAAAKAGARRDLLPDVEEINSTLKPSERAFDPDAEVDALPDLSRRRNSFRSGFMMMIVLAALGLITYLAAPQISAQIPGLTEPLNAYVGFVDMLRVQLDGLMQSATVAINGESGG